MAETITFINPIEAVRSNERAAGTLRGRIYRWLIDREEAGGTDEEIQEALGINPSTQRPRRVELVVRGLVRDSGERRLTRMRRRATVWVADAVD